MLNRLDSHLTRAEDGELVIEQVRLSEPRRALYGTPLHVISETRLRENYRRIRDAFAARWDPGVEICYAIKANPALAVRRVLADEGAHGDCLGLPELQASLIAGTPGHTLVLNGNNKADDAIRAAVRCGARINVDDPDEPARIRAIAAAEGRRARVGIRTKPDPAPLSDRHTELAPGTVGNYVERSKWGLGPAGPASTAAAILTMDELELVGLHCHLGRHVPEPELFGGLADALVSTIALLASEAGWHPDILTVGGGFTQGRDPYFRKPRDGGAWPRIEDSFVPGIELYADALCTRLADGLDRAGVPAPAPRSRARPLHRRPGRGHRDPRRNRQAFRASRVGGGRRRDHAHRDVTLADRCPRLDAGADARAGRGARRRRRAAVRARPDRRAGATRGDRTPASCSRSSTPARTPTARPRTRTRSGGRRSCSYAASRPT